MEKGEIILYQPNETIKLEVRLEEESVWLTRQQLALLFNRDVKTIGKHINNALREELDGIPVVAKFATTTADGKRYNTEHYNLVLIDNYVDKTEVYHIGASLKDLGKKMFAFSKMNTPASFFLKQLKR